MNKRKARKVATIAVLGITAGAVFGFILMTLWNWLMPALFGLRTIGFWQALGIFILSKILFGGFRQGPGPGRHWRRLGGPLGKMTPEERERFRQGLGGGCDLGGREAEAPGGSGARVG
jgi:hypothetical protein